MIKVVLTPEEHGVCIDAVQTRMSESKKQGLNHATTYSRTDEKRIEEETVGACGEMALAKALGLGGFKPAVNTFHNVTDLPANIEVRATRRTNGRLIIRDNDPSDRWYFLVVGEPPVMNIVGFILGKDAKRELWLTNPNGYRPAWFVPQSALIPAEEDQ